MKKIISFLCVICLTFSVISVSASGYQYGAIVKSATMEGDSAIYITNHNEGGFTIGRTTEESRNGSYSYYIDTKTSETDIRYTQQFEVDVSQLKNNRLLFEGYVKKDNDSITHASIWYYNNDGLAKTDSLNVEEPDEDGWRRCWKIVDTNDYDATTISMNYGYTYNANDGLTKIYYDDYSARLLPVGIYANDIISKTSKLSLNKINVLGYDALGNASKIKTTDLFKNTVVSGDAHIDSNNNLIYTGDSDGVVEVKCTFFDCEDTYSVKFELPVTVSEITERDGVYSVNINNSSDKDVSATLCVVVYDGDRLALVNTQTVTALKDETTSITCEKPQTPYYVKNPIIKAYVLK